MPRNSQAGFTLLELLVVIVIIGLLAGYVAPRYFSQVGKSEIQVTRAQIDLREGVDQQMLTPGTTPPPSRAGPWLRPNNEPK
jgi:general secretion pathway protein G